MEEECPVCCEILRGTLRVILPCSSEQAPHALCMRCFIHLQHRVCPLCRTGFESSIPQIQSNTRMNLIEFLQSLE